MRVSQFPETYFCWGSFSKMDFRRRPFNQKPLALGEIQGPIWRSKDHLVMKGLSKIVKNHEFQRFHYSVRQKIGDPGSISTQNMFPLLPVTPKRPELPYGVKKKKFAENPFFWFFPLLIPYWSLFGPYLGPI